MTDEILDPLKSDPNDVLKRFTSDFQHSSDFRKTKADQWYRYYRKYRGKHDEKFLQFRAGKFTIFVPLIFSLIENIVPRFVLGTFGSYPYINIVPVGEEDIEPSKKAEQLLNTQLSQDNIILKAPGWFKQFSMYGTSPAKVVWKNDTATIPTRNGLKTVTKYLGPSLVPLDVMDLFVDPGATDEGISSAGYIIHQVILNEEQMFDRVQKAKQYGYDFTGINWKSEGITPGYEMWEKFKRERSLGLSERESKDRKYWIFHEYWTPRAILTFMNKRYLIRRSPNMILDYPFINLNRNPMIGEFYGVGDIECSEDLMDEINYLRNLRLDNIDLLTSGMFLVERSAAVDKEELVARAGKTVSTNDINGVKQLVFTDITDPSRKEEDRIKTELLETSGVIDMLKGNLDRSNVPAAGMAMLIEAASYRIKLGLLMIEHHGIRQIGEKFMRLNYLNLPDDHIVRLVGGQDAGWLKLKSPDEVFGNFDFIPSGSSEFLNKETLKQSILQLYNLVGRDPDVDKVGLKKLLAMAFGGRMVEQILLGKGVASAESGGDETEQIAAENEQMLQGTELPPVGDHVQHIQGHQAVMNQPEFAQINSGIQGIFGRHLEGHQRAGSSGSAPMESPDRMTQEAGKGLEESMKASLQRPTAG